MKDIGSWSVMKMQQYVIEKAVSPLAARGMMKHYWTARGIRLAKLYQKRMGMMGMSDLNNPRGGAKALDMCLESCLNRGTSRKFMFTK